jgi:AcrR family transcriptional regulator
VTLYRWVGSREQLTVEVLWTMTERAFAQIRAELEDRPGPRLPEAMRRWVRRILDDPGVRHFLHGESEFAMRLLTLKSGGFQPRLFALVHEMLAAEVDTGRVVTPLPLDELTYAVIRICESYIYLPAITGEPSDPEALCRVLDVLLGNAQGSDGAQTL